MRPSRALLPVAVATILSLWPSLAFAPPADGRHSEPESVHALLRHLHEYYGDEVRKLTADEFLNGVGLYLETRTSTELFPPRYWAARDWGAGILPGQVSLHSIPGTEWSDAELVNVLFGSVEQMARDVEKAIPDLGRIVHDRRHWELNRRVLVHALWWAHQRLRLAPRPEPKTEQELIALLAGELSITTLRVAFDIWYDELLDPLTKVRWFAPPHQNAFGYEAPPLDVYGGVFIHDYALIELHPALGAIRNVLSFFPGAQGSPRLAYFLHRDLRNKTEGKRKLDISTVRGPGTVTVFDASYQQTAVGNAGGNSADRTGNVLLGHALRDLGLLRPKGEFQVDPGDYVEFWEPYKGTPLEIVARPLPGKFLSDDEERDIRTQAAIVLFGEWNRVRKNRRSDRPVREQASELGLELRDFAVWNAILRRYRHIEPGTPYTLGNGAADLDLAGFIGSVHSRWLDSLFWFFPEKTQFLADLIQGLRDSDGALVPLAKARIEDFLVAALPETKDDTRSQVLDLLQDSKLAPLLPDALVEALKEKARHWTHYERLRVDWIEVLHSNQGKDIEVAVERFLANHAVWEASAELVLWESRRVGVIPRLGQGQCSEARRHFERMRWIWYVITPHNESQEITKIRERILAQAADPEIPLEDLVERLLFWQLLSVNMPGTYPWLEEMKLHSLAHSDLNGAIRLIALRAFREGRQRWLLEKVDDYFLYLRDGLHAAEGEYRKEVASNAARKGPLRKACGATLNALRFLRRLPR